MAGKRGFGTIRRLPSGRYQAYYTGPDRERHSAGTYGTKRQAESALAEVQREIDDGTWISPEEQARLDAEAAKAAQVHKVTVSEYAEVWIPTLKSHSHRANTATRFRLHINPVLGTVPVADLTRDQCDAWFAQCCPKHPTQKARTYEALHAMLSYAIDRGVITTANPLRIKGATSVTPEREPQTASEQELQQLMEALPEVDRAGVLIAAWCGMRVSEVCGLQRQDIIVDPTPVPLDPVVRIKFRRHLVQNRGRLPGEPSLLIEPWTKAADGSESVVIPPHIVPDVWEHLDRFTEPEPTAWLFPARLTPTNPLHPSTLDGVWQTAKKKVGMPTFTYHDLRRTGNTLAAEAGATLAEMMERLRHRNISAAQRYIVSARGADAELARRMSEKARKSSVAPVQRPVTPPATDDRDARIAELEAELRRLRDQG